ncbi:MAG: hypothetical protein L6V93_08685 [Clostridiales bacterium]|nr:MAG: hypothetical protein L6V93_08685 [Clostridiales bacterium]
MSDAEKVLSVINGEPIHIDKISALTGISVSDLSVCLLELELNGKNNFTGRRFIHALRYKDFLGFNINLTEVCNPNGKINRF